MTSFPQLNADAPEALCLALVIVHRVGGSIEWSPQAREAIFCAAENLSSHVGNPARTRLRWLRCDAVHDAARKQAIHRASYTFECITSVDDDVKQRAAEFMQSLCTNARCSALSHCAEALHFLIVDMRMIFCGIATEEAQIAYEQTHELWHQRYVTNGVDNGGLRKDVTDALALLSNVAIYPVASPSRDNYKD